MSRRLSCRLASAALCGCAMVGGGVIPAHAGLLSTPQTVHPHAGNVNTTNVSVCGKPDRYDGDGNHHEGQTAHVSIPVQVSPSVISYTGDGEVKDAVIAVPTLLDHVSITVESVVGYTYDKNDDGEDINPQPVVHTMNLRLPTDEEKTRVIDKATGLSGMVRTTAKAAGFDDGTHDTDREYNVYDVSTFARLPELKDAENTGEFMDDRASVVNYRIEGDISSHNLKNYDSVPVAVKAGAWRSGKNGESPRSTADAKENDLSQFEWGRILRLPEWTDQAEMSQVARSVVPGAGVDWGGISANKDGDESHILGDVNPTHSWAKKYTQEFKLGADRGNFRLVSGFDGKDDGFDMGLVSVHDCDASPSPTPEASVSTPSLPADSSTPTPDDTSSAAASATTSVTTTPSASAVGTAFASENPSPAAHTSSVVSTVSGSSAVNTPVSPFPVVSTPARPVTPVSSRNSALSSNDADSDRDASTRGLPATGQM